MTGCVGAIDGCALKISRPRMSDVADPNQFFNRKGFYAIVLQAICDHKRRFLFGSATESGSTHDSAAFKASGLYKVSVAPSSTTCASVRCINENNLVLFLIHLVPSVLY